jgi:hypothetical protein
MNRVPSAADRELAAMSPEDRRSLMRGEGIRSRSPRYSSLRRGVSVEADNLLTILQRAGGERLVRSLVRETGVGSFTGAAAAELAELGLAERVGEGDKAVIRLLPAAEGVCLVSSWSMRD